MIIQHSPIISLLLVSGLISILLSIIGWHNRAIPISRPFTVLMIAETVWIFGYALELMNADLATVLFFNNIEYLAILTVPVALLVITLYYTRRKHHLSHRMTALLAVAPVLIFAAEITNPYHHLFYTGFHPITTYGSVVWVYEHGPLFWGAMGYCYVLSLLSFILIIERSLVTNDLYRRQTSLLILATAIPTLVNLGSLLQVTPFPEYDLTSIGFLIAGLILAIGILRYNIFSSVPVAYSQVFSTMRDGVIVTDDRHQVIDLNPASEQILGVSPRAALGRSLAEIRPQFISLQRSAGMADLERRVEILIPLEGETHYFDVLIMPMDENLTGFGGDLFLFRDVTERKRVELALSNAHKKINLLASITHHDLNNKLQTVHSYLELTQEMAIDPLQMEYLSQSRIAVNAMSDQIAFARGYEQIGVEAPAWQRVDALLNQTREQLDLKSVNLTFDNDSFEVLADLMLGKVFYNLFDNAIKYGGDEMTSISVSSCISGGERVIVVEDNGGGIPAGDKDHLFKRGFGKNTGLGLFLSREILSITDISIHEAGEPGKGARFEIRVPEGRYRGI